MTTRFWKTATKAQKLAQIDGAIELGMTSIQCAKNCGVNPTTLRVFASTNGRRFGHGGAEAVRKRVQGMKKRIPTLRDAELYDSYVLDFDDD